MNVRERQFYDFLMALPESVFDNWLATAPQEELDLADRLFDEVKFGHMDVVDTVEDAQRILKRFTIGG